MSGTRQCAQRVAKALPAPALLWSLMMRDATGRRAVAPSLMSWPHLFVFRALEDRMTARHVTSDGRRFECVSKRRHETSGLSGLDCSGVR